MKVDVSAMSSTLAGFHDLSWLRLSRREASPQFVGAAFVLVAVWAVFFLWPTAGPFAGTHSVKFAMLAMLMGLGCVASGGIQKATLVNLWLGWALASGVLASLSYTVFMHQISFGDASYIARPFFLFLTFALGFMVGSRARSDAQVTRLIGKLFVATLAVQLVVGAMQAVGIGLADAIYSAEKASAFGGILRVTGTMANPNILSFHLLLATTFLAAHAPTNARSYTWLLLGLLAILIAGSRTVLLVYVLSSLTVAFVRSDLNIGRVFKLTFFMLSAIVVLAYVVFWVYIDYFPYVGQLKLLFTAGDVLGFRAFALRISNWISMWSEISTSSAAEWMFGKYRGVIFQGSADNDWIFALWRTGLFGILATISWYFLAFIASSRIRCPISRKLIQLWLVILIVLSTVYETVSGWLLPFLVLLVIGLYTPRLRTQGSEGERATVPSS